MKNHNVHVFCTSMIRNKFGLNLETVFSHTGGQKTLWTTLPLTVRIDTLKRPKTFTLPHQDQHSEHYFHEKKK